MIIFILWFLFTRQKYWNDCYPYESQYLSKSDAEYLNTFDLRLLFDDEDTEYLGDLGKELIMSSYNNNGIRPEQYSDIITEQYLKILNVRSNDSNSVDNKFTLKALDVKNKGDKAIVFWGVEYEEFDSSGNVLHGTGFGSYSRRIYFEKKNNKWIMW